MRQGLFTLLRANAESSGRACAVSSLVFQAVTGEAVRGSREAWTDVWLAASNAGGAIDFSETVGAEQVGPLVDVELERAAAGESIVGVLCEPEGRKIAFAVLEKPRSPLQQHWRRLARVMVHPDFQGIGIGAYLVGQMHEEARRLGLQQLRLTVRGGEGLEKFYGALGYRVVGCHPDGVLIGPGQYRDEVTMVVRLIE
ncbi:GNAT family N-acetyltransferase [Micromonospora profundi]|uniref:GNAT family N-acetyltransferase n=1 Tax=Micromonospora profundi TaxID=1420889 RepID=UPI002FF07155